VVCDDVYGRGGTFEVVAPVPECFEDSKQFLIVGVIVQLQSSQGLRAVCDWMDLSIDAGNRQVFKPKLAGSAQSAAELLK